MAPRTTFAQLPDGLSPFTLFDQAFADTSFLGVIPCTASAADTINLTPIAAAYPPTIGTYSTFTGYTLFSFFAAATSTGAVTMRPSTILAYVPLYLGDGVTAAGAGDIINGAFYVVAYAPALSGFVIVSSAGGGGGGGGTEHVNVQTGTTYTVLSSDRGKLVVFTNSGAVAVTLPTFPDGWVADFEYTSTGTVTITAAGLIEGSSTLGLTKNRGVRLASNGSTYYTQRGTPSITGAALSVLGNATNASTLDTDITGTTDQVLRVNSAGTVLGFGSIDLSKSGTVGASILALANGGSNAALVASNGGIIYSTATAMAVLAGTATAGQTLISGSSAAPSWSTSTFPGTAAKGAILNATAANVWSATVTPVVGNPGASQGTLGFAGLTSGTAIVTAQATAGSPTLTLPNASGTFAVSATAPLVLSSTTGNLTITAAALTKADDTNVTLTLGGSPSTALIAAASITAGWTGQLALARGGTNASLVASNGGIFYSTASAGAILSGTATAGQHLQSGASGAPSWTTATFPATSGTVGTVLRSDGTNWVNSSFTMAATTTINQLLYSSSANTIVGLATTNGGMLNASTGGVPSMTITPVLGVPTSSTGTLGFAGITSGTATITPQSTAGTPTLTLPNTSGTFAVGATAPLVLSATTGNLTITAAALTKADDTNVTLTLGGSPSTALIAAASITAGWTGQLSVARGGTGIASGTSGGIPYYSGTTTIASSALLTQFGPIYGGGAGATPVSMAAGTDGQVIVGQTSAAPLWKTASGDLTISAAGAFTIANNAVTNAKAAQMTAYTIKGNTTGSTANATDFTIGGLTQKVSPGASDQILIVDVSASNALKYATVASVSAAGSVASIAGNTGAFTLSNGITNSTNDIRLATIATGNMLANTTGSTAVPVATALPVLHQKIATFTTDATSTTATVYYYRAVGGGGGGGGSNGANAAAGGGGGGAYMEGTFSGVAASVSVTVTLGAGGTAGANTGGNGGNGGATTISATGMTTVTAGGGTGGTGVTVNNGAGGAGGTITAGTPLFSSAGSAGGYGSPGGAGVAYDGGRGATSPLGNGGDSGVAFNNAGGPGSGNGAGGGGAVNLTAAGGVGSAGACIITYVL